MIIHLIAIRNLVKGKYRTLLTLGMIVGAAVALSIFRGFVERTLELVENSIVNGQVGHLQLGMDSYWNQQFKDKKEAKIDNYLQIANEIAKLPDVQAVSPRNKFFGLLSTSSNSNSAAFIGVDMKTESNFSVGFELLHGEKFDISHGRIMVGGTLAKRLKLKVGDEVTVVANTLDHAVNSYDFQVSGIFATGTDDFDSVAVFMDLNDAFRLMNSSLIDILKISVKNSSKLDDVRKELHAKFSEQGLSVRAWYEISDLFRKVKSFYNAQSGLMFVILVFIVLLGVSNTVSMALIERIGEIGTLRALGQSKASVLKQFMTESFYLNGAAFIFEIIVTKILVLAINAAEIKADIPGASLPVKIEVEFYWHVVLTVGFSIFVIVNIYTVFLVRRFLKIKIVEALRYNI